MLLESHHQVPRGWLGRKASTGSDWFCAFRKIPKGREVDQRAWKEQKDWIFWKHTLHWVAVWHDVVYAYRFVQLWAWKWWELENQISRPIAAHPWLKFIVNLHGRNHFHAYILELSHIKNIISPRIIFSSALSSDLAVKKQVIFQSLKSFWLLLLSKFNGAVRFIVTNSLDAIKWIALFLSSEINKRAVTNSAQKVSFYSLVSSYPPATILEKANSSRWRRRNGCAGQPKHWSIKVQVDSICTMRTTRVHVTIFFREAWPMWFYDRPHHFIHERIAVGFRSRRPYVWWLASWVSDSQCKTIPRAESSHHYSTMWRCIGYDWHFQDKHLLHVFQKIIYVCVWLHQQNQLKRLTKHLTSNWSPCTISVLSPTSTVSSLLLVIDLPMMLDVLVNGDSMVISVDLGIKNSTESIWKGVELSNRNNFLDEIVPGSEPIFLDERRQHWVVDGGRC